MHGWRARIGLLYPSAGLAEPEFQVMAPSGVSFHTTRMRMPKASVGQLKSLADNVAEEASLLADAHVNLIAFACTAGSMIGGTGYDQQIINRIRETTGIEATTTTTAVLEALRELKLEKISLITPYLPEINRMEIDFLKNQNFQVIAERGLGLDEPLKQLEVSPWRWYKMASEVAEETRRAGGSGFLISCGGIQVVEMIKAIEQDTGMYVVTSNQALLWKCLRQKGIHRIVEGFGKLFKI